MQYKEEQLGTATRNSNAIEAVKIKGIEGSNIVVERFNGRTERFPVSYPDGYKVGQYLDMVFFNTGSNSHGMKLVGHTPPQFYPDVRTGKNEV